MICGFSQCGVDFEPKNKRQKFCCALHRVYAQREADGKRVLVGAGRPPGSKNKPKEYPKRISVNGKQCLVGDKETEITITELLKKPAPKEGLVDVLKSINEPTQPATVHEFKERADAFADAVVIRQQIADLEREAYNCPDHIKSEPGRRVWKQERLNKIKELKKQL